MSNYSQDQRFGASHDRTGARPRDDAYGRRPFRDQRDDYDEQRRGWQQEAGHPRNYGSSAYGGGNYDEDDYAYGANPEGFYRSQEQANPSYRSGRGQHRGEPWPRNEDRENYASVMGYEHRNYEEQPHRYYDDEARAANRFARPQRFASYANGNERSAPTSAYFSPSGSASGDPRNAGNYAGNYADNYEPRNYGGYSREPGYAKNSALSYAPNYSPSVSPRYSQNYGDTQRWQERDNAQVGAFGIQSHRGKGPQGYTRSDERIKEDVCEQLSAHHYIDASEISVSVKDGVVTLEGCIGDRWQKYQAEDLIDATSGVKDINNRLTIKRAGTEARNETDTERNRGANVAAKTTQQVGG